MKTLLIFLCSVTILNAQWTKVDLPNTTTAQSFFVDGDTLYVGGDNNIFYTTNGSDWNESSVIGELFEGVTALIKVNNRIFAGSFTHGVYESTDNGNSWIHRSTGLPAEGGQKIDEFAVRGSYLYAATLGEGVFVLDLNNPAQWEAFRTGLDFGVEWTVNSIFNFNDNLVAGAGANASMQINSFGSNMWKRYPFDIFNQEINSLLSITSLNGVLHAASYQAIYRSTNGGTVWEKFNPGVGIIGQTSFTKQGEILYVNLAKAGRNFIYKSTDNGVTWNLFDDVRSSTANAIEYFNNRIYSGRFDGLWYYPLTPTDVEPDPVLPNKFLLERNYPNPFNPSTKIRYIVGDAYYASPALVTLKVYNILGNEVATLVNERKPSGEYEIDFTADGLASGIYLYKLSVNGQTGTKKMTLLK
ncbi:MAG: T9SS type A sorting domain-containing protein [Ignavibacteriales bacterium]|nr:MAG: T9SS type A sorting domain-containing protein [Ignavibacteriales bacterium]